MKKMKSKIVLIVLSVFLFGCTKDYPYYEIKQTYEANSEAKEVKYDIETIVYRYTEQNASTDDAVDLVYSSKVENIPSSKIDSTLLHEKSIANVRVGEFKHLDDLTSSEED